MRGRQFLGGLEHIEFQIERRPHGSIITHHESDVKSLSDVNTCQYDWYNGQYGVPERLRNRLKGARADLGLSQEQLAILAGVTRQTISSIETGQYGPSALLAFLLAKHLRRPVDDVFFLEEE
jgi:putative transcriptional regulator